MYSFKSLDKFTVLGDTVFSVENPVDCMNFDHLLGQDVEIDGINYHIYAIERFLIYGTYRKGKPIGLMVTDNFKKRVRTFSIK